MPYTPPTVQESSALKAESISPIAPPADSKEETPLKLEPIRVPKSANADDPTKNISEERLRKAFESVYVHPKHTVTNFSRRPGGSYQVERIESKFQGFKLAVLGIASEDISLYGLTGEEKGIYD
jgi:hypothetical protein